MEPLNEMPRIFLHVFDLGDQLKCSNLASNSMLQSLAYMDVFAPDNKPNPRFIDIELLRDCTPEIIDGRGSPRMLYLYLSSTYKYLQRPLDDKEEHIRKVAHAEVEFERIRRDVDPGLPSRLSALFLADDDMDSREMLGNMFRGVFQKPQVLHFYISNDLGIAQVDSRWLDVYMHSGDEQAIVSYWKGEPCGTEQTAWEYLFEGTITLANEEDRRFIRNHTFSKWPGIGKAITDHEARTKKDDE